MNNQQLIQLLELNFPILKNNIGTDNDGNVVFSIEMDDPSREYDKLDTIIPTIESHGYEVTTQDDEFFGAIFSK